MSAKVKKGRTAKLAEAATNPNTVNGRLCCTAHPLLVQVIQSGFDDVADDIGSLEKKVDTLQEFMILKKSGDDNMKKWKDRIWGMIFVILAAIILEGLRQIGKF